MMKPRQDEVRHADRIQCLECGRWFRALPRHVLCTHAMSEVDYRLKFAVPKSVPLVCREWSERLSEATRSNPRCLEKLTARGPAAGFEMSAATKANRAEQYQANIAKAQPASARKDRTAERRKLLAPYPVTLAQAAERLGISTKAAGTFLSYCVRRGRLRKIARNLYDSINSLQERP